MDSEFVLAQLKGAIAEVLNIPPAGIHLESRYLEDLGATSMDLVMLCMLLEEELEIQIPNEDLRPLVTVGSTLEYLLENYFHIQLGEAV